MVELGYDDWNGYQRYRGFVRKTCIIVIVSVLPVALLGVALMRLSSKAKDRFCARNEEMVKRNLHYLIGLQEYFRVSRAVDINQNGRGEYGYFKELSGDWLRNASGKVTMINGKSLIQRGKEGSFKSDTKNQITSPKRHGKNILQADGFLVRNGYYYRIFLPDKLGHGVPETQTGYGSTVDPAKAETMWWVYAWPIKWGVTGRAAFFDCQSGDLLRCRNKKSRYSGTANTPQYDAAFKHGVHMFTQYLISNSYMCNDGEVWVMYH